MQRRMRRSDEARDGRREERLDVALDVEEIDASLATPHCGGATGPKARPPSRSGWRTPATPSGPATLASSRTNTLPSSKTRKPRLLAREVDAQDLDQAADEARAHHRERRGDRIDDADRRRVAGEVALPALVDEAEVDGLLPAEIGHRMAQRARAATDSLATFACSVPSAGPAGKAS
jgi:hypothetical protein